MNICRRWGLGRRWRFDDALIDQRRQIVLSYAPTVLPGSNHVLGGDIDAFLLTSQT